MPRRMPRRLPMRRRPGSQICTRRPPARCTRPHRHYPPPERETPMKNSPFARVGTVIHIGVVRVVFETPDGPQNKFYWWASENENINPKDAELHGGPFDTAIEADEASKLAILGPDCEINFGGQWDPAWGKPQ